MISTTAQAFTALAAFVIAAVALILLRYLARRTAAAFLAGLAVWVVYVFLMGWSGLAGHYWNLPPGIALLLVPVFGCILALAFSPAGRLLTANIPLPLLVGFQVYRVGVELTLAKLNELGLTPHIMTLAGGNFEILMAVTAPLAALASLGGVNWQRAVLAWNVLGLVSLANIASRAVLTAPGPLNLIPSEVPDLGIITYPFTSIPGFMAPLAVLLHILAIRAILIRRTPGTDTAKP